MRLTRSLRALATKPLVHSLLIGTAIFFLYRVTGGAAADPGGRIVISPGEVDRHALTFTRLWTRPPSAEGLRGLIDAVGSLGAFWTIQRVAVLL